uniref:WGS project CBMG000000000 data, contig CS5907-c001134 n=1 Tax=Fusarium acuminatum CS5907 TaxID=1318461 RepID=A0A096PF00_9HYPO|nr:unnamed protein product [Fusarium acuminatum CS5907]
MSDAGSAASDSFTRFYRQEERSAVERPVTQDLSWEPGSLRSDYDEDNYKIAASVKVWGLNGNTIFEDMRKQIAEIKDEGN